MRNSTGRLGWALWPWMAIFAVASALDLFLTWRLLQGGAAVEANPLAAKILAQFGWWGLGFFKAASVAVVLFLGPVIWRKSRPAARLLMQLASCILVLVVTYSSCHMAHVEAANCLMTKERDRGSDIVQKRKNAQLYFGKLDQLTAELVAGKVTLPGAAKELTRYLDQVRHNPLRYL